MNDIPTPTHQHILITGASSGLGAALALAYARHGITLSLQGRHVDRLGQIARRCMGKGADVVTLIADVRDTETLTTWITERNNALPLDIVIANAGVSAGTSESAAWFQTTRAIFDINLYGVLNTLQPILPHFIERQSGQSAIISSLAGFRGFAGASAYCASKAAIRVYGEALRLQCRPHNVKINVVCPGFVKTPMTDQNPFPMPFKISAERAANLIKTGLEKDRPQIAFPWPMVWAVRLIAALPQRWLDGWLTRLPRK